VYTLDKLRSFFLEALLYVKLPSFTESRIEELEKALKLMQKVVDPLLLLNALKYSQHIEEAIKHLKKEEEGKKKQPIRKRIKAIIAGNMMIDNDMMFSNKQIFEVSPVSDVIQIDLDKLPHE
jgi:ribosomal protein S21